MGETTTQPLPAALRFITVARLMKEGHYSRTAIWRMVKSGDLPKPIRWMGKLGWREETLAKAMERLEEKVG